MQLRFQNKMFQMIRKPEKCAYTKVNMVINGEKSDLSLEEQIMTLKEPPWNLMIECNSLSLRQYIGIIYTIMLQVVIMIFNLSYNLANTQLFWEFRWTYKSCVTWNRVMNWPAWRYTCRIIVKRNIHFFHTNVGYWYAYISCIL